MYVEQVDFFRGASMIFVNEIMKIGVRKSMPRGDIIFHEGDPAIRFYILLNGRVRISIGESGHVVYIVSNGGEAFGWSSLIGRQDYSASAECLEPTKLIAFDRDRFQNAIEKDPANGIILYRGLAMTLANRLLQTYKMISSDMIAESIAGPGTGQFQEPDLPVG